MITLKHLKELSESKIKTRRSDGSILGLVWRISATGQVSAAYRLREASMQKAVNRVFCQNMPLQSDAYQNVRKQAMSYMLKAANGEPVFEEKMSSLSSDYTLAEYNLIYHQDRPIEQMVKDRLSTKKGNSVKRDVQVEKWIFSRPVEFASDSKIITLGEIRLNDESIPRKIDHILNEVARTGQGKENFRKGLAHLKRMFANARRNGVIDVDPLEDVEAFTFKSTRAKDIPPAELLLILRECRALAKGEGRYSNNKWKRLGLLFEIKIMLGCRLNELNTLRKDQINFVNNTFEIDELDTKTGKRYRFAFPQEVAELFKTSPAWDEPSNSLVFGINNKSAEKYDETWHKLLDSVGLWGHLGDLIIKKKAFLKNRNKSDLSHNELTHYEAIAKEIKQLKESRPRGHDTRHAFATSEMRSAIENGVVISENDMNEIASNTGKGLQHSSVEMTMHYTHVDDEMKRGMVSNRLNTLKQLSGSAK